MLIIENNSVYEIDEECLKKKKVPKECQTLQKLRMEHRKQKDENPRETQEK